jgi:uncharacterized RDD family membrane protein YckC
MANLDNAIEPIDGTISIVTPENITFRYSVAGPFQRATAFFIDFLIRIGIIVALLIATAALGQVVGEVSIGFFLISNFVINWFYGAVFETYMNGQTPGKRMMGIRAVTVDGKPINAMQAVMRNLIRTADTYPLVTPAMFGIEFGDSPVFQSAIIPTFIMGLIVMSMNKRYQRIGDLVAGTMVIVDQRKATYGLIDVRSPAILQIAALVPPTFRADQEMSQALAHFVDQRPRLSDARRREIAAHLTEPLSKELGLPPHLDPDLLLQALYYRAFVSDARQELAQLIPTATVQYHTPAQQPLAGYGQAPMQLQGYRQAAPQPLQPPGRPPGRPRSGGTLR